MMTSASAEEGSSTPPGCDRRPSAPPSEKKSLSADRRQASSRVKSFVAVGLEKKVSPSSAKAWSDLSLTLHGRDKITKILQYLARLLAWWLRERNRSTSKRLSALSKSLSTSRKAFRLGRSLLELEKLQKMGIGRLFLGHFLQASTTADSNSTLKLSLMRTPRFKLSHPQDWKSVCAWIRVIGMLGYFAGDNVAFLSSSGVLDNHSQSTDRRLKRRRQLQDWANLRANQAYFAVSLAGLVLTATAYGKFQKAQGDATNTNVRKGENKSSGSGDEEDAEIVDQESKQKQFALMLSLVKSCCDVIVFSNNPGIDLHQKWRGKKNNETLHCLCGLIAAGTDIYNYFPDKNIQR